MNFVKSSQNYISTDVSHVSDQGGGYGSNRPGLGAGQDPGFHSSRQGLGFGGPQRQGHGNAQSDSRPSPFPYQNFGGRGPPGRFNGPQGNFMGLGARGGFNNNYNNNNRLQGRFSNNSNNFGGNQQGGYGNSTAQQFSGPSRFGGSQAPPPPPTQQLKSSNTAAPVSSTPQSRSSSSTSYSGFVKPQHQEDHFEGGSPGTLPLTNDDSDKNVANRPLSAPSTTRHPYVGPRFPGSSTGRTTGRFAPNVQGGGPLRAGGRGSFSRGGGGGPRFGGGGGGGRTGFGSTGGGDSFTSVEAATAAAARATREATNPNAKCIVLATTNPHLAKFRRLAEEIRKLKSKRPNAIDTIHSAANIAQVNIQSELESGPIVRGTGTFFCLVQFDGVNISVCSGLNKRSAKNEAFDMALQKLMKPYHRIVQIDGGSKELQAADYDFAAETPKQTVIKPTSTVVANISGEGGDSMTNAIQRESNVEALVDIKKKNYVAKDLSDFVLVEPEEHNSSVNGASILRRSADFSKMLLEYDFAAHGTGGSVRCVLKVEGQALADVVAYSKMASKVEASQKAVDVLREKCWTILTKQVHDSNGPEITKEEMFADLASSVTASNAASMATPINDDNLGKKLLQKMGWTGGGMGKDGMGIEEPVTMKQVINREGLGLDAKRGITGDFRARVTEVLESYASSERQDDLVFSPHFRKDERIIIHNECRRLNLKSKSNGQGNTRYLIVRRKRSAFQLLEHVMESGGETARYKVVPPGQRKYPWRPLGPSSTYSGGGNNSSNNSGGASQQPKSQGNSGGTNSAKSGLLGASPNSQASSTPSGSGPRQPAGQNRPGQTAATSAQGKGVNPSSAQGLLGQSPGTLFIPGQNPCGPMATGGVNNNNSGFRGPNFSTSGSVGHGGAGLLGQNPVSAANMGNNNAGFFRHNVPASPMGNGGGYRQVHPGAMGNNGPGFFGQNPTAGLMRNTAPGFFGQNPSPLMGNGGAGFYR